MYVCMYVCMYVREQRINRYVCMFVYKGARMHVSIYIYVFMYVYNLIEKTRKYHSQRTQITHRTLVCM